MFGLFKKKKKREQNNIATLYVTELLFVEKPSFLIDGLVELIEDYCGAIEVLSHKEDCLHVAFSDCQSDFVGGKVPYQMTATITKKSGDEKIRESLTQSWSWEAAAKTVESCNYKIIVTDLMGQGINYKKRIEEYQKFLFSLCKALNCSALHFCNSQNVVSPKDYLAYSPNEQCYNALIGILNIRSFGLEGTDGEVIMDTLGLSTFGLVDLQCHFKNINRELVAQILYYYSNYLYMNGDVIKDGDTIQGVNGKDKWICNHKLSMLSPKRPVLNICPGNNG